MKLCWFIRRYLVAYQDEMLGQRRALWVARHLRTCLACQRELHTQQRVTALLRSLPYPSRQATYWPEALQQLQMKTRQQPPEAYRSGWFDYLTGAFASPAHALVSVALVGMALLGTVTFLGLGDEVLITFISYILPIMQY